MEIYGRVRRAVRVEGRSQRAVAREFGLSRETVRKMLAYAVPPGYQRQQPIKRPRLGPWLGVIDAILADDKQRPAKQRHTAKRIFDRLRDEHGFTGGYTIVKDYVRGEQVRSREMFVPLTHAPGEAQADFGEALVVLAGLQQKAHAGMQNDVVNSTLGNLGVQVFEADGATWLTNFTDPPQNSKRASAGDLLPVSAAQNNLDANSNPPSPGPFAICGIHEVNHVFHARLLVSTSAWPPMAIPVLAPAAVLVPGQLDAAFAEHALPLQDAQAAHTQPLQDA